MIETIAKLLNQSGASRANISVMIDSNDDNKVNVIINTFMPPAKSGKNVKDENADIIKLRHALSAPLSISGDIGVVDVSIEQELTQFAYGFVSGSEVLKSASDLVSKIESASADVKPKTKSSQPKETPVAKKDDVTEPAPTSTVSTSAFVDTGEDDDDSL